MKQYTNMVHIKKPFKELNDKTYKFKLYLNRNYNFIYNLIPKKFLDNNFYYEVFEGNTYIKNILSDEINANLLIFKINSNNIKKSSIKFSINLKENLKFQTLEPYKKYQQDDYDIFYFKLEKIEDIKNLVIEISDYKFKNEENLNNEIIFLHEKIIEIPSLTYVNTKFDENFWKLKYCKLNKKNQKEQSCEYIFKDKEITLDKNKFSKKELQDIEIQNKFHLKYENYHKLNLLGLILIFITFVYTQSSKIILINRKNNKKFFFIEFLLIFLMQIFLTKYSLFINCLFLILTIRYFEYKIFKFKLN